MSLPLLLSTPAASVALSVSLSVVPQFLCRSVNPLSSLLRLRLLLLLLLLWLLALAS